MFAVRPESHIPTALGPDTTSSSSMRRMPPEHLPAELWHQVIMLLDDRCFAWIVLRQVSPFLASVTEDVFARYVSRTCSIRFAGQTVQNLLPSDIKCHIDHQRPATRRGHYTLLSTTAVVQPPTFRFQPSAFVPANTKARLILKLRDSPPSHETLSLHKSDAGTTDSSSRLAEIFFRPGPQANTERARLIKEPHFMRFNDQLKSMRIPSGVINVDLQEISLDWRRLCANFMRDEFKCRYEANSSTSWKRAFE